MPQALLDLIVVSNFAEVFLAKAQHAGRIGINLLEKVQLPNPASLFGAMLAKVDVVLMGAGIPRAIPAILDKYSIGEPVEMAIDVAGALPGEKFYTRFDPRRYLGDALSGGLKRPQFLAIVSVVDAGDDARPQEHRQGGRLRRRRRRRVGTMRRRAERCRSIGTASQCTACAIHRTWRGIRDLGLPFWMGGSHATPDKLAAARTGRGGIQVGTAFAFCDESGISRR